MQIRPATSADLPAVDHVHRTAFGDHGAVVAGLLPELTATTSLVAEADGEVVGHVQCGPGWLDAPRRLVVVQVLSPLAVLPDHQGRGTGAALVAAALDRAGDQGAPAIFLEGDPGYYGRLGFRAAGDLGFRRPSLRIPEAAFQVVLLPAHEPWMTGTLVYPDVFWRHDAVGLRDPDA
ncbi:putative acetyltransferase [Klenkia soli]|uniref:Putative acetyltransferase n=1 Tax=Klenkia soli TaxID=1052260 RepID=A0A1H0PDN2_9ACTN|nr:N-acetyltransferase [Klenkia soli]SDP03121.1 putative acetyltransferase [Klenkia soli]